MRNSTLSAACGGQDVRRLEQLELPLWKVLKEATIAPEAADLRQLLDGLDEALLALDAVGQLQVAAEAVLIPLAQRLELSRLLLEIDGSSLDFDELTLLSSHHIFKSLDSKHLLVETSLRVAVVSLVSTFTRSSPYGTEFD